VSANFLKTNRLAPRDRIVCDEVRCPTLMKKAGQVLHLTGSWVG
jgi:hypothetical protein